jgi:hypothetical protein
MMRWALFLLLSLVALGSGPFLLTVGSYAYFEVNGTILPDVRIGGVPVGGLTTGEAQVVLDRAWNQELRLTAVDLHDASRAWVVAPAEFGLYVDPELSALSALELTRNGPLLDRITTMLRVLQEGIDLVPVTRFEPAVAEAAFNAWRDALELPPRDAFLTLEQGELILHPAELGWRLDIGGSVEMLASSPEGYLVELKAIPFAMQSFEPPITDVSATASQVQAILDQPPSLKAYDPVADEHHEWVVDRLAFASWLDVQAGDGIAFNLDDQELEAFLQQAVATLGAERELDLDAARDQISAQVLGLAYEPLIIGYRPTVYVVQPGDQWISLSFKVGMPYWKLQEANPTLLRQGLIPGSTLVLPPRDDMLTLPVIPEKRIVIDISEQRMSVFEEQARIHEYVISTGIPDSPTLPGIFQISSHFENAYASIWDLYMPHFMGIYDAVPGLTNGIHGLPLLSNGRRLWADVLGRPASFGCIILDLDAAETLYDWAEDGVVVAIQG